MLTDLRTTSSRSFDNVTPTGMRLCRFCGSLVPEAQYIKHQQEMSRKGGQALRGSAAAYKKARNAARARWSRPRRQTEKCLSECPMYRHREFWLRSLQWERTVEL